jgi:hypothetical protein
MGGGDMLKKIVTWIGTISILCQIFSSFASIVHAETFAGYDNEDRQETQLIPEDNLKEATENIFNAGFGEFPESSNPITPVLNSGIRLYGQNRGMGDIFADLRRAGNRLVLQSSEFAEVEIAPELGIYWRIELFSSMGNNVDLTDETGLAHTFNAGGVSYLNERVEAFNSEFPTIKTGDVLKIFHREADSRLCWSGSREVIPTTNSTAYFGVTETGFTLLQIERVTAQTGQIMVIGSGINDTQLQSQAASYLNLENAANVEVGGFTRFPDRSVAGRQSSATIRVQEKISNETYVQKDYDAVFTIRDGLEATTISQRILLGENLDVNQAITAVRVDGRTLTRDQYRIDYDPGQDLDVPGTRNTSIRVTDIFSARTADFLVPVTITWGETLLPRGIGDRSGGALAYLPNEKRIVARRGDYMVLAPIHQYFPDLYYSLAVLRNNAPIQMLTDLDTIHSYEAAGINNVNIHVGNIGTLPVEYGDILKVYHAEARTRLRIFRNNVEGALSHNENIAYLELTPSGYRQVLIDRVVSLSGTLSQRITDEQLDKQAASYLDLRNALGVKVIGFIKYPDRSRLGETTGTILVQETLSNGNSIQMEYEVPFTVHQGLEAVPVEQTLSLGGMIDPSKVVKDVKYNNQLLANDAYEITLSETSPMRLVGNFTIKATIIHRSTNEKLEVDIPVTVQWGNTLLLRGHSRREILGLSLLQNDEGRYLIGTQGSDPTNHQVHAGYLDEEYFKLNLLSGAEDILLGTSDYFQQFTYYGREYKEDIIADFGSHKVTIGDVLEVKHFEAVRYTGMMTLFKENQQLDTDFRSDVSYYDLTENGLKPLDINNGVTNKHTILPMMSNQQLEDVIETYLDVASTVEIVRFTNYPDRSQIGETTGTILVQEKLSNGNYIQMEYEVPFIVQGVRMLTDVPNLDFGEIVKSSFSQMVPAKTDGQKLGLQIADFIGKNNWSLQVYQSPFQDSQGQPLKGAEVILDNISVQSDQGKDLYFPETIVLNTQPTELISYHASSAENDITRGYTNVYFGSEEAVGVHLDTPHTILANSDTYKTTISWELVADPSQGAKQYDE